MKERFPPNGVRGKKRYYTLKQISRRINVKPHTLAYWQKKFSLKPKRVKKAFFFDEADIDEFKRIKHLIKNEGYTIAGAKRRLAALRRFEKGKLIGKEKVLPFIKKGIREAIEILETFPAKDIDRMITAMREFNSKLQEEPIAKNR